VLARHLGQTGRWTGDHGQGLETTLAQVVADELGARIDGIGILQSDNTVVAHGTGTNASRTAVLAGGVAALAARLLKERVIRAASHLARGVVRGYRNGRREGVRRRYRSFADIPGDREGGLFRKGPLTEGRAGRVAGHQGL
jgi:CO/xanthine dehydrogenase Mo-binding subunit